MLVPYEEKNVCGPRLVQTSWYSMPSNLPTRRPLRHNCTHVKSFRIGKDMLTLALIFSTKALKSPFHSYRWKC